MKYLSPKLKSKWLQHRDIILFVVALLVSNYFWKYTVSGDEAGEMVTWFGLDITAPFTWMAENIANAVYWIVSLFRDTLYQINTYTLRFESGSATRIVWSCTPIKQCFIWLCIMLATPKTTQNGQTPFGSFLDKALGIKLLYTLLCMVLLYGFNIFRIVCITLIIEHHPELFELMHTYIFKYLFYGFMFLLWVYYVEKIRK